MIKSIFIQIIVCFLVITIIPISTHAAVEPPVTKLTRKQLFKKLKWSNACQDKYLQNLKLESFMDNEGLEFTKINTNSYILRIQCDQRYNGDPSYGGVKVTSYKNYKGQSTVGTYEVMQVKKRGNNFTGGQIFTFKSRKMWYDISKEPIIVKTQISGNIVIKATPSINIFRFEPTNFFERYISIEESMSNPFDRKCGTYTHFVYDKYIVKPTMNAQSILDIDKCYGDF